MSGKISVVAALFCMGFSNLVAAAPTELAPLAATQIAGPVLMVTDLERSLKFYTLGLGMTVATRLPGNPGPGATVTMDTKSRAPFILLRQIAPMASAAGSIHLGDGLSRVMLLVPSSQSAAARLEAAGFSHTPVNEEGIFFARDPDGYSYEIMEQRKFSPVR